MVNTKINTNKIVNSCFDNYRYAAQKLITTSIITAASMVFTANAQLVTISATHQLPTAGDTVHYVDANSFGFDPIGTGPVTAKIWDESALFLTGTTYDFTYVNPATISGFGVDSFPAATIARGETGAPGYFYYQNTANDINRIGFFSTPSNYGIYENGTFATEFHFPITAGQTVASTYYGRYAPFGVGEDSVTIESGSLSMNADMQGTMILPTGTFTQVLRLHVIESFHIKTYIFGVAAIDNLIQDDYYYWFADTILQPILVSGVTSIDGTAQSPVLRYQPISTTTGINNNTIQNATIYPNPSTGKFFINADDVVTANNSIEIYNLLGEKINYTKTNKQSSTGIDISNAPKGIYYVKIYSGQNIITQKMVIQ